MLHKILTFICGNYITCTNRPMRNRINKYGWFTI